MIIQLNKEQEQRIQELIRSGRFQSVDQLIDKALETLSSPGVTKEERLRRARTAATRIRKLRRGLSLEGLKIRDLIEKGRL
jgi:Arc/MetJ-type ribon-helix-helix transcriptional regulator